MLIPSKQPVLTLSRQYDVKLKTKTTIKLAQTIVFTATAPGCSVSSTRAALYARPTTGRLARCNSVTTPETPPALTPIRMRRVNFSDWPPVGDKTLTPNSEGTQIMSQRMIPKEK